LRFERFLTPRSRVAVREELVSNIVDLEDIELIPVLQLDPYDFRAGDRPMPSGSYDDMPGAWHCYWLGSLADSGLTGVVPVQRGSWNVPTSDLADATMLRRVLEVILQKRQEMESAMEEPHDWGPLHGGLALCCQSQYVVAEPGCCADLSDAAGWRGVVDYRDAGWSPLPIGHPTQSVQYRSPRLIISDPHETMGPTACWAVCPEQLRAALVPAQVELERFAERIAGALPLSYEGDAGLMSRKLAGL
jgi:hypothetical protein